MSRTIRTLVLTVVGAVALTSAGTALAAYTTPKLLVTDAQPSVTINYEQSASDDPTAKLHFFAPTEYSAALTQPAGQTIGTVTAQGTAADLGGALLPLTGTVQVRAANGTYLSGSTQVPIAAAATQCTGTATHTAYWVLILQAAGQTLELPVFVDSPAVGPGGTSATAYASASIQACLPPPDVPPGTPGRATFGFKLTKVDFRVNSVFTGASSGQPRWRLLATPYTPGRGTPNQAGSVEAQSVIGFPRSVTLRRPAVPKAVRGFVTLRIGGTANLPAAGTLRLYRGARSPSSASILLRGAPAFSGSLRIKQTTRAQTVFLQVRATVPAGTVACTATFGVQCLSATRAAIAVRSNVVRVVIPRRR